MKSWLAASSRRYGLAALLVALAAALTLMQGPSPSGQGKQSIRSDGTMPPAASAPAVLTNAAWSRLSAAQRRTLAPLRATWSTMSEVQQAKWRLIADRFASRPRQAQRRLAARISEWARLSPQDRAQARLNFLELAARYNPGQRKEKWLAFQNAKPDQAQASTRQARPGLLPPVVVQASPGATTVLLSQMFDLPSVEEPAAEVRAPHDLP